MAELIEIAIPAAVGLATGVVGSLVAPWANWRIEEAKQRIQTRRNLINQWREHLGKSDWYANFEHSVEFSTMRLYLSKKEITEFTQEELKIKFEMSENGWANEIVELYGPFDANAVRQKIFEKIAKLEKKWGLI